MATDIRPIRDDELDRAHFLIAYSFSGDRTEEGRQNLRHVEEMGGVPLGLYEDGQMVACLRILPLAMLVNGVSIPLGGVSAVASLPEHRRKGYVGQLLRHALAVMREQGQPLSALYTPHPSLYRRYGWMVASTSIVYKFNPKEIHPYISARPAGNAYRATEEDWPTLAEIHRRFTARRNGYLDRSERWWKEAIFRRLYDDKRRLNDVAVWADDHGEPRGYLAYHTARERRADGAPVDKLAVHDFAALDGAAYLGLLRYLFSHDLAEEISWQGPIDEPLLLAVDDSIRLKGELWDGFMLRIVDIEKAVAARPPAAGAPQGAFTVHIADAATSWNQGAWRVECSGGRLAARRVDGTAGISTDAATFAVMYNGFLKPSEAVRAGLAEASDPQATALADRILASDYRPYPADFF